MAFLPKLTERLERMRALVVIDNIESLLTNRDSGGTAAGARSLAR